MQLPFLGTMLRTPWSAAPTLRSQRLLWNGAVCAAQAGPAPRSRSSPAKPDGPPPRFRRGCLCGRCRPYGSGCSTVVVSRETLLTMLQRSCHGPSEHCELRTQQPCRWGFRGVWAASKGPQSRHTSRLASSTTGASPTPPVSPQGCPESFPRVAGRTLRCRGCAGGCRPASISCLRQVPAQSPG